MEVAIEADPPETAVTALADKVKLCANPREKGKAIRMKDRVQKIRIKDFIDLPLESYIGETKAFSTHEAPQSAASQGIHPGMPVH